MGYLLPGRIGRPPRSFPCWLVILSTAVTAVVFLAFERRHRDWLLLDPRFARRDSPAFAGRPVPGSGALVLCFGPSGAASNHLDLILCFSWQPLILPSA